MYIFLIIFILFFIIIWAYKHYESHVSYKIEILDLHEA